MKDKVFENKVDRDVEKTKKDLVTLGDDGVTGVRRVFEKLGVNAKKATASLNKGVVQGLSQYNEKVQDIANRVPGDFSKKATGNPWVAITITLAVGLLLGVLLKPARQPVG